MLLRSTLFKMAMTRFAICDLERWGSNDKEFLFTHFFYNTFKIYERLEDDQKKKILAFWNEEAFGNPKGRVEKTL
ncbi:hypothetical protein PM082_023521 [Marasmius tenuissimus]|nr:hypothetical protein PM082_023521 [Marasmius tenuissimus]